MRGFFFFLTQQIIPSRCIACGIPIYGTGQRVPAVLPRGWPPESPVFFNSEFSIDLFRRIPVSARVLCAECWLGLIPSPCAVFPDILEPIPAVTPFITNDMLLKVIRFLKFNSGRASVPSLAWWIAASVERYDRSLAESDAVIVPVPLHSSRRSERGYNQAELLAVGVGSILRLKVDLNMLVRRRKSRPQSSLGPDRRRINVENAFVARKRNARPGRTIIMIDDLITTGETARACLNALREADSGPVIAVAAGRSA